MNSISEEMQQLQLRILELEKQKIEKNNVEKQTSIDYNFNVIHDVLIEKKTSILNNRYSKSVPLARYHDQQLILHLNAIYNILQIIDKRLQTLEEK
jgi:hypothetical protein